MFQVYFKTVSRMSQEFWRLFLVYFMNISDMFHSCFKNVVTTPTQPQHQVLHKNDCAHSPTPPTHLTLIQRQPPGVLDEHLLTTTKLNMIRKSNNINNKGNPKEHKMNFYCPQLSRICSAIGNNSISKLCQNNFKISPFSANKVPFQAPENAKIW